MLCVFSARKNAEAERRHSMTQEKDLYINEFDICIMNFKEGFKPNKWNLSVGIILGFIMSWFHSMRTCFGPSELFPCGLDTTFSGSIIPFIVIYLIVSLVLSFVKK